MVVEAITTVNTAMALEAWYSREHRANNDEVDRVIY